MSTSRRPIDAIESLRSTRRSLGDGTVAGRARSATPARGGLRGRASALSPDVQPIGETIAVGRLAQVFDGGGTSIEWYGRRALIVGAGFDDQSFPADLLVIPRLAYYRLDLSFRWQTWRRGGRVQVLVNGEVYYDVRRRYATSFDRTFDLGVLEPDDAVEVVVSPIEGTPDDPFAAADGQIAVDLTASLVLVELPKDIVGPTNGEALSSCVSLSGNGSPCGDPIWYSGVATLPPNVTPGDLLLVAQQGSSLSNTSICCSGGTPSGPGQFILGRGELIRSTFRGAGVLGSDQSCVGGLATIWLRIATQQDIDEGIPYEHNGTGTHGSRCCVINLRGRWRESFDNANGSGLFQGNTAVPLLEGGNVLVVQRSPSATGATGGVPSIDGERVELLGSGTWVEVYACGPGPSTVVSGNRNTGTRLMLV